MRERVKLRGRIRGEGREATCTIAATRVRLPGAPGVSQTVEWSMLDVSEPLPDGDYEVDAEGETAKVRQKNGMWLGR